MQTHVTANPMNRSENPSDIQLIEICGILPFWITQETDDSLSMLDIFNKEYSFGVHEMTGGEVNIETGEYTYPEDPPLYPLIKVTRGNETMYQYEYAIVAIVNNDSGETFVTRLD